MDLNFDHQMSLSKSKSWYSNICLQFLKRAVPLDGLNSKLVCLPSQKTLTYYKIRPFPVNYESVKFYSTLPGPHSDKSATFS